MSVGRMNGAPCPLGGCCICNLGTLGLTFLSVAAEGPGLAARTFLEGRLRVPFILLVGTGSLVA
jgi:hypothetical protein